MSPILIAQLLAQFGTVGIPLIQKLMADITARKTQTTVTAVDLEELQRLSQQTAAQIFAGQGVIPPPPAAV